jgi:hypothetical protein
LITEKKMTDVFPQGKLSDVLHRHDAVSQKVEKRVLEIIDSSLPELKEKTPDANWNTVVSLLRSGHEIIAREGSEEFQNHFKNADGTLDTATIAAFSHLQDIVSTVRSYVPVLIERSFESDNGQALQDLSQAIKNMKKAGYGLEDVQQFFKDVKISKSFTVHPTEHHNEKGISLDLSLVSTAELPPEHRDEMLDEAIRQMILSPIGAEHKNSILEEIDASDKWARIHNQGASDLERFIGDVIEKEYGARPEISLDIAPRSWDYDSDGKNNAEGWAMMAKMATTTMGALNDVDAAVKLVENLRYNVQMMNVNQMRHQLFKIKSRLQPIYERSRAITQKLAELSPEDRKQFYIDHYEELKQNQEAFAHIYDDSDPKERGFKTYRDILHDLNKIRKSKAIKDDDENVRMAVDNAFRNLRRTGLALEKGQTRQNDIIHSSIIDNFFASKEFRAQEIISAAELDEIDSKGGISKLSVDRQYALYEKVVAFARENGNRAHLVEALFAANPLTFEDGGNGYPLQERTLLDRFALRTLYPLKFDQGIISDAGPAALTHQKFLADLFGMSKMRHMPLFEDRSTLSNIGKLVEVFNDNGGRDGVDRRRSRSKQDKHFNWFFSGRYIHDLPLMVPCSDSTRGAGSGALMEITHEIRKVVRKAFDISEKTSKEKQEDIAVAFEVMLGGGLSMGRFGADVGFMRRVIEQELKEIAKERGRPFDRNDKIDRRMMRMAAGILYTEQGRAKRYYTATSAQVTDDFARRITEMVNGRFDLEGLVPDNAYIAKPHKFTNPAMNEIAVEAWHVAIDNYIEQRFQKSAKGGYVLDNLAEIVTCPNAVSYMNNGARPAAKKSGVKKMTGVRAIENDQRNNVSRLYTSGFGMGAVMEYLESKHAQGVIDESDIRELFAAPEWDYLMFTKEYANALRVDFSHAEKALAKADEADHEERAYLRALKNDHARFVEGVKRYAVNPDKQFPVSRQIANEDKAVEPALAVVHLVEEYIKAQPEDHRSAAIKALGGEKFMRQLGSAYRSGTMPHWMLWMGQKNAYTPSVPVQSFDSLLAAAPAKAVRRGTSLDRGLESDVEYPHS